MVKVKTWYTLQHTDAETGEVLREIVIPSQSTDAECLAALRTLKGDTDVSSQ